MRRPRRLTLYRAERFNTGGFLSMADARERDDAERPHRVLGGPGRLDPTGLRAGHSNHPEGSRRSRTRLGSGSAAAKAGITGGPVQWGQARIT